MSSPPNKELLDAVNAAGSWVHYRKTKPIRVKRLERDEEVETLEGRLKAKAGAFLCRGETGELWPQDDKSLASRYRETDEVDADGWRKMEPHPDTEGVMAAQVPHPFTVNATWGLLNGKAGDYVAKVYADRDSSYPADVWIVAKAIFHATYEKVQPS